MTLKVAAETWEGQDEPSDDDRSNHSDEQDLAVAELLRDQFGDYSDPQAYDWSWRETD